MEKRQTDPEKLQENKRSLLKLPVKFSVVMPLYNAAPYVKEAVLSVLEQTYSEWELIVVDDGSDDGSLDIIRNFAEKNSKIKIFTHDGGLNRGVSATRNLAIYKSTGSWIALLDADDTWYPDKLKKEAQIISIHPEVVLLYSKAKRNQETPDPKYNSKLVYGTGENGVIKEPFKKLLPGFFTSTSAVTFKKEVFVKCGGFNENLRFSEDTLMFHQIMEHGNVYCIDEILGTHRIHDSSAVSTATPEKKITSRYIVYEQLIKRVRKENKKLVADALVDTGLLKIFRSYLFYPQNKPKVAYQYLKRTIYNRDLFILHKIKALILFIIEVFLAPLKTFWLKTRHK